MGWVRGCERMLGGRGPYGGVLLVLVVLTVLGCGCGGVERSGVEWSEVGEGDFGVG
jgi:hypothetical protein